MVGGGGEEGGTVVGMIFFLKKSHGWGHCYSFVNGIILSRYHS